MYNELLQLKENNIVTTSLLIAEKFKKEHYKVIRKIESILVDILTTPKMESLKFFEKSEYVDSHGQSRPMYFMNRDGFTLLAMGFTGKEALTWKIKYIHAFNEMEKQLKNPTPPLKDNRLDIARLIARSNKQGINAIKELYPEYFTSTENKDSLEYICDTNSTYMDWINDCGITKDWLLSFPTNDIFNNYQRYCIDNKVTGLGKKTFYSTLEQDFNLGRKQRTDGFRYFD